MEYDNLHMFGVVYELDFDAWTYNRNVYSFLEWLS